MKTVTKHSLWASGLSLLLCAALLLGTTFAWFTDSVTNTGNTITAGTLGIKATVAEVDKNAAVTYTVPGLNGGAPFGFGTPRDLEQDPAPILSENNWEPGVSDAKLLTVTNDGNLAANIRLNFNIENKELEGALWFDFLRVENGAVTGSFVKRPMSELNTLAQNMEIPLADGESVSFILAYGMYEEADNTYQGKSYSAGVEILASQAPSEADGFGNTHYDDQAGYLVGVSSAEELAKAAADGNSVRLDEDIVLTGTLEFGQTATLQMNGHTLTVNNGAGSVKTTGSLTVEGNGLLKGALEVEPGATLVVNAGDDFKVESESGTGSAVYARMDTTVEINGGTYTSYQKNGTGVIETMGRYLTVRNATVNVGVDSVMQSFGINASNAKETLLENVTVNGNYSIAVKLNGSASGNATIIGGTFTTNMVSEGLKPKPTIQYGGTLNISGATINRVGVGIYYRVNWPIPTEVVGLTQENVTFNPIGETAAQYQDVDYYHY
ncbi:SipW-dependent-type signal peptide-containing protein [Candidatus Allofournierella merdipullorum]|uniref:SipW-dependent-type signal peptide-containing protein n=1 Tax=Candidatus Allofournierella merdipullorum TaxID=2838595 RepID=UPI00374FA972